jgi:4-amino-4-deoxy-L-arabinose transferase-like glycosyltransferase
MSATNTIGRASWQTLLIAAMAVTQATWFVVRSRLAGAPLDAWLICVVVLTLAAGIGVASLRVGAIGGLRRRFIGARLRGSAALLALGGLTFVAEALLAVVRPTLGWDEPSVFEAAQMVARGGVVGLLDGYATNPWLALHHPPLGPILFGFAMRVPGHEVLGMRLLVAACAAVTVATAAWIARSLYDDRVARRTGLLLLACPLFVRIGAAAMNDMLVTCLATLGVAIALLLSRDREYGLGWLLGIVFAAGLLVKYTGVLVAPVVFAVLALHGKLVERRRALAQAAAISLVLGLVWIYVAHRIGVLQLQIRWFGLAAGVSTRTIIGPWSGLEALVAKLPSALGLYNLPLLVLGSAQLGRRGGKPAWVVVLWIVLVCVPLLLTLPDNRYFLPAFPAFAMVMALGLERLPDTCDEVLLLSLLLCLITLVYYSTLQTAAPAFLWRRG